MARSLSGRPITPPGACSPVTRRCRRLSAAGRDKLSSLPPPLAEEGWGGGSISQIIAGEKFPPPAALVHARARRPPPLAGEGAQRRCRYGLSLDASMPHPG